MFKDRLRYEPSRLCSLFAGEDEFFFGSAAAATVTNSCRFNDGDTAYSRDVAPTAGDSNTTATVFGWFKLGVLGTTRTIWGFDDGAGADEFVIELTTADKFRILMEDTADLPQLEWTTTQVFRDPSAWYHFIWSFDTTPATPTSRLWINGVEVTAFTKTVDSLAQNDAFSVGSSIARVAFGARAKATNPFDGYLSGLGYQDGQVVSVATGHGTFNSAGVFTPKDVTGLTYGTTGRLFDFAVAPGMGNGAGTDVSGNDQHHADSVGLAAADQVTDTPAANFCTISPVSLATSSSLKATLSDGNLVASASGTDHNAVYGTIMPSSGKWYWEVTITGDVSVTIGLGIAAVLDSNLTSTALPHWAQFLGYGLLSTGSTVDNASSTAAYGDSWVAGDVIGVAWDADTGTIWFSIDGVWQNSATIGEVQDGTTTNAAFTGMDAGAYTPVTQLSSSGDIHTYNFGQSSFIYTQPTGYLALNTTNLAAAGIADGTAYFQANTRTGTGAAATITQGGNSTFQPDLIWIKQRSASASHAFFDIDRFLGGGELLLSGGVDKLLLDDGVSNLLLDAGTKTVLATDTNAAAVAIVDSLTAINSNGFDLGTGATLANTNENTETYVDWMFKESATAGIAVNGGVSHTNGVATNVAHGLGATPKAIIAKRTDSTGGWYVFIEGVFTNDIDYHLFLDTTAAQANLANSWGSHSSINTVLGSGLPTGTYSVYSFVEVDGFSKFGSFEGNGSSNGPVILAGGKPAFFLYKNVDAVTHWGIRDRARGATNPDTALLPASASAAESSHQAIDWIAGGVKVRSSVGGINGSGNTIAFMVFCEHPFGGSNVAPATAV